MNLAANKMAAQLEAQRQARLDADRNTGGPRPGHNSDDDGNWD